MKHVVLQKTSLPDEKAFVEAFGHIYEDSPWVARNAWQLLSQENELNLTTLATVMKQVVETAGSDYQMELIRKHPDLAGRAALAGAVTADSSIEQSSAGLDQCTPDELSEFNQLNKRYVARFNFPFIMAVRGANKIKILAAFRNRLGNDVETEFSRALSEIHKIARLRLEAMADEC